MNDFPTFWYVLASALASILILIIGWYVSRTEKLLEELTRSVGDLKTKYAVHENRLKKIDDGDELAEKIVMKLRFITPR